MNDTTYLVEVFGFQYTKDDGSMFTLTEAIAAMEACANPAARVVDSSGQVVADRADT